MPILVAVGRTKPFLYYLQSNGEVIAVQTTHTVDQLGDWFAGVPKCDSSEDVKDMLIRAAHSLM